MLSDEDRGNIEKYFKGTQKEIADNNYLYTLTGVFHINPIPDNCIPELKNGTIDITIVFSFGYPFESPQSFIKDEKLWIFAHTRIDGGKTCPPDRYRWFKDSSVKAYLDYLNEWFLKAAQNELELPDDYYELPQFPISIKTVKYYLIFIEENPGLWIGFKTYKIGEFYFIEDGNQLRIEHFDDIKGKPSDGFQKGVYVWLPVEPIVKYRRPPVYFYELEDVLKKHNLSIKNIIDKIYEFKRKGSIAIIGFPIKEKNKDLPTDIHWQGFNLDISGYYKILKKKRKRSKIKSRKYYEPAKDEFLDIIKNEKIPYIDSLNCSKKYMYSRIGGATKINNYIIFGCGAIGSHIAFQLARAGCNRLAVCDSGMVEPGNICRHLLDFSDVRKSKAIEISVRLSKINPWGTYIPYISDILSLSKESDELKKYFTYDLWIDAGLPAEVSYYLSELAKQNNKRMLSVYITNKAKYVVITISGDKGKPTITEVEQRLRESLRKNGSGRLSECLSLLENSERDIGIRPNTGCYYLTFEATGANISALSAIAYSVIADLSEKNYTQGRSMIYYYDDVKFIYDLIFMENNE